ncbi:hypothetical protein LRR81_08840 [Metabacillus sp. GX 13764]|uniref:hypothetical protein n=1 Tax=Metabacillus kandeliae TaxID=2900151 RepID=UPI001E294A37|nr:hypothetical protein [Metabacillus kandeliae]MCD7034340.1 hypothetical protein [Metabacillus kandeliae]
MKALEHIVKQRNHEQREVDEAYGKIKDYQARIRTIEENIIKKEQLVSEYDAIIAHSEELLHKNPTDSVPQNEEVVCNE